MNIQESIVELADQALLESLEMLGANENEMTVGVLLHLAEVDRRKLFAALEFSSLFAYCTKGKLRYAETAATRRITCARAIATFPDLMPLLLSKELSLTTLSLAAKILTAENKAEVLEAVKGKSLREVDEYLAAFRPEKEVRDRIRPVVVAKEKEPEPSRGSLFAALSEKEALKTVQEEKSSMIATAVKSGNDPATKPRSESAPKLRYELRFLVSAEVMQKLNEAQALLSGTYPRGMQLEDVLDAALESFLERRSPRRREMRRTKRRVAIEASKANDMAEAKLPPKEQAAPKEKAGRYLPQELRDKVWERDGGSCNFIGQGGVRCGATRDLEFHHLHARGLGGSNDISNISLRCRVHNCYEAERDYGASFMQECLTLSSARRPQRGINGAQSVRC